MIKMVQINVELIKLQNLYSKISVQSIVSKIQLLIDWPLYGAGYGYSPVVAAPVEFVLLLLLFINF